MTIVRWNLGPGCGKVPLTIHTLEAILSNGPCGRTVQEVCGGFLGLMDLDMDSKRFSMRGRHRSRLRGRGRR
jgi:hypothetical protein